MKSYCFKMIMVVLIISSFIIMYKEKDNTQKVVVANNTVLNSVIFQSSIPYNKYEEKKVYQNLTLKELGAKIDKELNSTLDGYGETIASLALSRGVDPVVASSIILLETGCKWECSALVKSNYNVGGMRSNGSYLKFATLEEGLNVFINNLAFNYYYKGLNTPELINTKYATNPNWHQKVYYYVNAIMDN